MVFESKILTITTRLTDINDELYIREQGADN